MQLHYQTVDIQIAFISKQIWEPQTLNNSPNLSIFGPSCATRKYIEHKH